MPPCEEDRDEDRRRRPGGRGARSRPRRRGARAARRRRPRARAPSRARRRSARRVRPVPGRQRHPRLDRGQAAARLARRRGGATRGRERLVAVAQRSLMRSGSRGETAISWRSAFCDQSPGRLSRFQSARCASASARRGEGVRARRRVAGSSGGSPQNASAPVEELRRVVRLARFGGVERAGGPEHLRRDRPAAAQGRRVEPARVVPAADVRRVEELLARRASEPGPVGRCRCRGRSGAAARRCSTTGGLTMRAARRRRRDAAGSPRRPGGSA